VTCQDTEVTAMEYIVGVIVGMIAAYLIGRYVR
jgi:multisubunit Na+/H+ antiporter MnhE subunit